MSKMNSKLMLALVLPLGMALAPPIASSAQSDTLTEWNAIMQATVSVAPTNPNLQTQSGAITQPAAVEAVNAILGDDEPDLGVIDAPDWDSPDAAAVMPLLRVGDGWDATVPYTPRTDPRDWQSAPRAYAAAFLPRWGQVTPFGPEEGSQFRLSPPPANDIATLCLLALFASPQAQPTGGGSSVTTTVIYPVSTWSGCVISGSMKATITATPNTDGTASVFLKLRPMGCHGSCGGVNGQFTTSTTVTIGAPVTISGGLQFSLQYCDWSFASGVCKFVVNADGTATVNSMALQAGCWD